MGNSGMGFIETVIASALGAGLAFGSCGNCNIDNKITNKVISSVNREVVRSENRIMTKLNNLDLYNQMNTETSTTYTISGKEYKCTLMEE